MNSESKDVLLSQFDSDAYKELTREVENDLLRQIRNSAKGERDKREQLYSQLCAMTELNRKFRSVLLAGRLEDNDNGR